MAQIYIYLHAFCRIDTFRSDSEHCVMNNLYLFKILCTCSERCSVHLEMVSILFIFNIEGAIASYSGVELRIVFVCILVSTINVIIICYYLYILLLLSTS